MHARHGTILRRYVSDDKHGSNEAMRLIFFYRSSPVESFRDRPAEPVIVNLLVAISSPDEIAYSHRRYHVSRDLFRKVTTCLAYLPREAGFVLENDLESQTFTRLLLLFTTASPRLRRFILLIESVD